MPRPSSSGALGATAIEHPLGVRERASPASQEHDQVVEDVGRLFIDALVGLLARGERDLLGRGARHPPALLDRPLPAPLGPGEQLDRVGGLGSLARSLGDSALERRQRLEGRALDQLAAVKARALTGVASWAGRLDEREQRVAVAVQTQRAYRLGVAAGCALVPLLAPRAAPQVKLARLA